MWLSNLQIRFARGQPSKYLRRTLSEALARRISTKMNKTQQQRQEPCAANRSSEAEAAEAKTRINIQTTTKQTPQLRREKQQQAAKKKSTPYIPGIVNLQVLGAGANGAPSSIYLFTDQSRYLFNCGEGTQRLAHEHKTKLARLEHIFVTRNTWPTIGGFPGLALTVQDAGVKELALHGPPYLDSILHSMKRFVVLKALQVKTKDCTQLEDFEDNVMQVKYVPLKSAENCGMDGIQKVVVAYICKLKPRPGALNLEKCVERGVPPGPLLGLLKNGIDVTLENGTVVQSKDVSEANEIPLSFVFLDIPSTEYLPAFEENLEQFARLNSDEEHELAVVVHLSPAQMLDNNCYRLLVEKFAGSAQHLYLNSPQNPFSGYVAAHRIQFQLNLLNPKIFPLLGESGQIMSNVNISSKLKKTKLTDVVDVADVNSNESMIGEYQQNSVNDAHLKSINSLSNFHLRPSKGLDRAMEAKLTPNEYISETHTLENFSTILEHLKSQYQSVNVKSEPAYPKVIFLGTGSCIPNKTRNVSAILVQPQDNSYMLLDCGEGTLGQIVRFFGKTKALDVIRNLKAIYISHLHADHHIGLIGLLNERQRLLALDETDAKKVLLFAPRQIQPWLDYYNEHIDEINNAYELIGNGEMLEQPFDLADKHPHLGICSIGTCLVRHCPHSFGVRLTLPGNEEPISITYSGDSMPCADLIQLGRDSTILIHEATMEDDLIEEAKLKMHSTISQAIQQGREMNAQHIILTHFSQRYAKLPRMQILNGECESDIPNVAIAFDNMQVTLGDLKHFNLLYPALRALFAEHAEELELKALKREQKLERKRKLLNTD